MDSKTQQKYNFRILYWIVALLVDFVGGGAEIKSLREYTNFSRF
jgi:hypothetical protein